MDKYLKYGSAEAIPHYNCSIDGRTSDYWIEQGSPDVALGVTFLTIGIATEIAYFVALLAMFQKDLFKLSCYKIMIVLGVYDMLATVITCIFTGYFWIVGAVYCRFPEMMYIVGASSLGLWTGSCISALILVVNRLVFVWNPEFLETLFGGFRIWLWIIVSVVYGLYFIMFTTAGLFNSTMTAWFFDPFIRANEGHFFYSNSHTCNNFLIVILTTILYIALCVTFSIKYTAGSKSIAWHQTSLILQSAIICSANLGASLTNLYLQYFPAPKFLTLLAHSFWIGCHAMPVIVYLTLNRTVQLEIIKIFRMNNIFNNKVTSVSFTTSTSPIIMIKNNI